MARKTVHKARKLTDFTDFLKTAFPELEPVLESGKIGDDFVSDIVLDNGKQVRLHIFSRSQYHFLDTRPVEQEDIDAIMTMCEMTRCANRFRIKGKNGYRLSLLPTLDGYNVTIRLSRVDLVHEFPKSFISQLFKGKNILLFGAPGVGKTTSLRSVMRLIDEQCLNCIAIDQSDELNIPGTNSRIFYPENNTLGGGILEAVRNHTPSVIILDEIVTKEDVAAVMNSADRGVQVIATTHASSIENIIENPIFLAMNGGRREAAVGDETMRKSGNKFLVERRNAPTFDSVYDVRKKKLYDLAKYIDSSLQE
jgi:stage III sporulation protein SpoIIIAA